MRIQVAHTADLDPVTLGAVRSLLWEAFSDMTEQDWEHAVGGMHALAWAEGELIGHASVVMRRLVHQGRALRAGYVEAVAVRASHRRQGVGAAVMAPLERIIKAAYDLGALSASGQAIPFYRALGWQLWEGELFALTPQGIEPTPDEQGNTFVYPGPAELELTGTLTADWRDGDVW